MKQKYFVAGTDTDAGKTLISAALLYKAKAAGMTTVGLKPIAAGCEETPDGLRNDDALKLIEQSTEKLPYEQVNPIAFARPIAPHIAGQLLQRPLSAGRIVGLLRGVLMINRAQFSLVEGAGGYRVPLNPKETLADVTKELKLPVILVVGMKLGCLNHALLTVESIQRDGLKLAGWVANRIDGDMDVYEENVETLHAMIQAPCLGEVPFLSDPTAEQAAEYVSLPEVASPA
jgi:dethiobiotin synthetase